MKGRFDLELNGRNGRDKLLALEPAINSIKVAHLISVGAFDELLKLCAWDMKDGFTMKWIGEERSMEMQKKLI